MCFLCVLLHQHKYISPSPKPHQMKHGFEPSEGRKCLSDGVRSLSPRWGALSPTMNKMTDFTLLIWSSRTMAALCPGSGQVGRVILTLPLSVIHKKRREACVVMGPNLEVQAKPRPPNTHVKQTLS